MEKIITTYKFLGMHFCYEECTATIVGPDNITKADKEILQRLAIQVAEIASLPIQAKRIKMWKENNGLKPCKPMVWMDEVCWHEMNVDNELRLETTINFTREIESQLRQTIYCWNHMQGDMVVEPIIYSPLAINNSGSGLKKEKETQVTDSSNDVVSQHYITQINNEADIDKIICPRITHDVQQTEATYQLYKDIFGGILKVEKRGAPGFWFAPWDDIVMWTGVQEALLDLIMRPEYIHKLMKKLMDIGHSVLDQYEEQNLLSPNNYNIRVGSGAYGYTDELPGKDLNANSVKASNLWGCSAAQILGSVSPEMFEMFSTAYEKEWTNRFGLAYYGCCEPLHDKIKLLEQMKNLRKISISPWADIDEAASHIRGKYVMSLKPSPAILAQSTWDPMAARAELIKKLEKAKGCNIEIIMKDISTVCYEPQRLWEWSKIASEVTQKFM